MYNIKHYWRVPWPKHCRKLFWDEADEKEA